MFKTQFHFFQLAGQYRTSSNHILFRCVALLLFFVGNGETITPISLTPLLQKHNLEFWDSDSRLNGGIETSPRPIWLAASRCWDTCDFEKGKNAAAKIEKNGILCGMDLPKVSIQHVFGVCFLSDGYTKHKMHITKCTSYLHILIMCLALALWMCILGMLVLWLKVPS